mgnify:CR=1 FL=1|jgi:hypothetical protein
MMVGHDSGDDDDDNDDDDDDDDVGSPIRSTRQ